MPTTSLSPYALADLADVASPDRLDSPGASFLLAVAEATCDLQDAHEAADAVVPVYTADVWAAFVDLAAYREDVRDLGDDGSALTRSAALALYAIGARLAQALLDQP